MTVSPGPRSNIVWVLSLRTGNRNQSFINLIYFTILPLFTLLSPRSKISFLNHMSKDIIHISLFYLFSKFAQFNLLRSVISTTEIKNRS